jgi:hypothetical protein
MCEHQALLFAILVAISVIFIARQTSTGDPKREGYLIYPYLDLDEPGERGVYYALTPGASDGVMGP